MTSILESIKKLIGLDSDYTQFDQDIIMHINTVFSILRQIGVGPKEGFKITSDTETWDSFLGEDSELYEAVKTYMYLKVRMLFDPPTGSVQTAVQESIRELEWRLMTTAELEKTK